MHIIKLSVYALKSRFQLILKPLLSILVRLGVNPNQVTISTCFLCIGYALLLTYFPFSSILLLCFPLLMLIRMALNALDGMLASERKMQTALGTVLNEVCDVISDAALFGAFLFLMSETQSNNQILWCLLAFLAILIEFVSLAVFQVNRIRSQSGPFGKSDRAVYLGLLAILLWVYPEILNSNSIVLTSYIIVGVGLSGITLYNRFYSLYNVKK